MLFLHKRSFGTKGGALRLVWWEGNGKDKVAKVCFLQLNILPSSLGYKVNIVKDWLEGANIDFHLHILGTVKHTGFLFFFFL